MVDLETATIRLYEEANLTEDLVDQDATTLLKWAEQQVAELVAKYSDDDSTFESAFSALRSLVKNMNRYVGQRERSGEAQQAQRLENISQSASEIGFSMSPTFGAQSFEQSPGRSAPNNSDLLQTMLSGLQKTDNTEGIEDTVPLSDDTEPQEMTEERMVRVFTLPEHPETPDHPNTDDSEHPAPASNVRDAFAQRHSSDKDSSDTNDTDHDPTAL